MPPHVRIFDLKRIFLGDLPWTFTFEIVLRTGIMYLFALLLIRFIGKRGMREMSPFEFVIIIVLGSSVGDPMFYPEIPLLHGMAVITTVIAIQHGLVWVMQRNERFNDFVYRGEAECLVSEGRVVLETMKKEGFSSTEVFMTLREAGVEQLGQVRRAYLEPSGEISAFLYPPREVRPGLPLMPSCDPEYPERLESPADAPQEGLYACTNCGETLPCAQGARLARCPRCGKKEWARALIGDRKEGNA
jgi:uncharacterized membrane protein YcaP (DUF421 family)